VAREAQLKVVPVELQTAGDNFQATQYPIYQRVRHNLSQSTHHVRDEVAGREHASFLLVPALRLEQDNQTHFFVGPPKLQPASNPAAIAIFFHKSQNIGGRDIPLRDRVSNLISITGEIQSDGLLPPPRHM
jgi:hypothetical protein